MPDRDQLGTDVRPATRKVVSADVLEQRRAVEKLANMVNDALATNQPVTRAAFDALRVAFDGEGAGVPELLRAPLRTILDSGEDWFGESPPAREWLLRRGDYGALAQAIVALITGPGGRGKSWLLLQLALSVATGRPWVDTFEVARPGRVLLALAEEEPDEIRRRFFYAARAMGLDEHEIALAAANIVPLGLHGQPVGLISGENRDVQATAVYGKLAQRVREDEFRLIILDPLSRFAPDVESNNAAATKAVQLLEALTKAPGRPTVMVCHHSNKQSRADGSKGGTNMVRGVTGLTDAVRWEAQLVGKGEDDLALHLSKGNYNPSGNDIPLERRAGEFGFIRGMDEDTRDEARSEAFLEKLSDIKREVGKLVRSHPGLSKSAIHRAVGGRRQDVFAAIEAMERAGMVHMRPGLNRSQNYFPGGPEEGADEVA